MTKKIRWLILPLMAALAAAACSASDFLPVIDGTKVSEHRLDNGLRIIVKEERQWPAVSLGMFIRAGSVHEGEDEYGAAHLVEHLLFEATDPGGTAKLAPFIESLGGRISANTLRDFATVNISISSRQLENVLPLLLNAVFEANFTADEYKRELSVVEREIADRQQRADLYLEELLWNLAFKDHPYRRSIGGTPEDIKALTIEGVRDFYRRFYVPGNMALVVVGDVEPEWLVNRVATLTARVPAREVDYTPPAPEAQPDEPRLQVVNERRDVTIFSVAWHAPSIEDKAAVCAYDMIYTLLGQGRGGRLYRELVDEKQLALSVDVEFLTQRHPGLMIITCVTMPDKEIEARAAVLEQVARLSEELVDAQEMARARRLLYTDYAFTNEAYADQVGSMGFYEAIDTYRFAIDYIPLTMQVSAEEIRQTARQYLRMDNYSIMVLRSDKADGGAGAAML